MGMFGPTDETAVRNQAFAPMNQAVQNLIHMRGLDQQNQYQTEHNNMMKPYYEAMTQKTRASIPVDKTPFTPVESTRAKARLKTHTGLGSSVDNFFSTYIDPHAQDSNIDKGGFYDTLSSHGKESVTELLNNVSKEHEGKLIKDPNYANTPQAKKTEAFMNMLYSAPDMSALAQVFMPDVAKYRKTQEENSKAAITEQQGQFRQAIQNAKIEALKDRIAAQKEINDAKLAMQEKLAELKGTKTDDEDKKARLNELKDINKEIRDARRKMIDFKSSPLKSERDAVGDIQAHILELENYKKELSKGNLGGGGSTPANHPLKGKQKGQYKETVNGVPTGRIIQWDGEKEL